jgi:hypothetical protein
MPRLNSGESTPVDMNEIDKCRATNLSPRRIMVEFRYQTRDLRWNTITYIYLESRGEEVIVRRSELAVPGDNPVIVGISGVEGGETADIQFRDQ